LPPKWHETVGEGGQAVTGVARRRSAIVRLLTGCATRFRINLPRGAIRGRRSLGFARLNPHRLSPQCFGSTFGRRCGGRRRGALDVAGFVRSNGLPLVSVNKAAELFHDVPALALIRVAAKRRGATGRPYFGFPILSAGRRGNEEAG
jgi:hypothetical protein